MTMRAMHDHHDHDTDAGAAPFDVEIVSNRRSTLVRVHGEIDAASATAFSEALVGAKEAGRPVLLDLSGTTFIDSAGIRILVRSMWDIRGSGSTLQLVAASDLAENTLRITGILDVLKEAAP
jgi:anti-anti-sigma factor